MVFRIGANLQRTGKSLLAAALVAVACVLWTPADAGLAEGIAAYRQGDYATARKEWEQAAEAGDLDALFNLGQLYRLGNGVAQDLDKAVDYYRRAADAGHVAAQGNLGTLYYFNLPGAPHVEDALTWWEQAAAAGDARSQYLLGVLYFNGSHVSRDYARAYGWTLLAARAGLPEAIAAEKTMLEFLSLDEIENGKALAERLRDEARDGRAPREVSHDPEHEATEPVPPIGGGATEPQNHEEDADGAEDAAPAEPSSKSGRGFYVQLMAMRDPKVAERAAERLRREYAEVLEADKLRLRMPKTERAQFYRLLLGPYGSPDQAGSRCADLKARGLECFVTAERD